MKQIQAEGTSYIYYARQDDLPEAPVFGLETIRKIPERTLWNELLLPAMDDFRLALISFHQPDTEAWVYYLHWNDGSQLDLLDKKVEDDSYTDEDFKHAVKTELQTTMCFACGWSGRTLVMPTGDPYLGAPGLDDVKLKLRVATMGFKRCPTCGANLRQGVVKIF